MPYIIIMQKWFYNTELVTVGRVVKMSDPGTTVGSHFTDLINWSSIRL